MNYLKKNSEHKKDICKRINFLWNYLNNKSLLKENQKDNFASSFYLTIVDKNLFPCTSYEKGFEEEAKGWIDGLKATSNAQISTQNVIEVLSSNLFTTTKIRKLINGANRENDFLTVLLVMINIVATILFGLLK